MPLIYTLTGRNTFPRVYVEGDPRGRLLRGRPPRATMLREHGNRLWAAGDPDHPSRLYFSEILNAEQWESVDFEDQAQNFLVPADAGFLEIAPANGERIRGIGETYRGLLPVYKDQSVYTIEGYSISDFVVRELTSAVGAVSHFGIANFADDQAFVSRAGIHSLSATDAYGNLEQTFLSRDIRDYWNEFVNGEALQQGCYIVDNEPLDRLEVMVPTYAAGEDGFTPNRILCLHYGLRPGTHPYGLWSIKKITGRSMATTRLQGASRSRVVVGSTSGHLNLQDQKAAIDFPVYGPRSVTEWSGSTEFRLDITPQSNIVEVNLDAQTVNLITTAPNAGVHNGERYAIGYILESSGGAVIPIGARIIRAFMKFSLAGGDGRYSNLRVFAEKTNNPSTYSTYSDFIGRTLTDARVDMHDFPRQGGVLTLRYDFGHIIQELVDSGTWNGDATDRIAIQVHDNGSFLSPFSAGLNPETTFVMAGVTNISLNVEYWT